MAKTKTAVAKKPTKAVKTAKTVKAVKGSTKKSAAVSKVAAKQKPDDLNKILGFTRKYQSILKEAGVVDYKTLGNCTMKRMLLLLEDAGINQRVEHYTTWARQAKMAASGKWDSLADYQKKLIKEA
jgi:predicted flap endonuclease-1-like 5' DNA nuclease